MSLEKWFVIRSIREQLLTESPFDGNIERWKSEQEEAEQEIEQEMKR